MAVGERKAPILNLNAREAIFEDDVCRLNGRSMSRHPSMGSALDMQATQVDRAIARINVETTINRRIRATPRQVNLTIVERRGVTNTGDHNVVIP